MNQRTRRGFLLVAGIVCLLAFLTWYLVFTSPKVAERTFPVSSSPAIGPATTSDDNSSSSSQPSSSPSSPSIAFASPTISNAETAPATTTSTLPSQPSYVIATFAGSSPIAVVDMQYLLTIHPPTDQSAERRAQALAEIRLAVSECARAFHVSLVLDRSAESTSGVRVVLSVNPALDMTAEVRQYLGR